MHAHCLIDLTVPTELTYSFGANGNKKLGFNQLLEIRPISWRRLRRNKGGLQRRRGIRFPIPFLGKKSYATRILLGTHHRNGLHLAFFYKRIHYFCRSRI
jgi:hypothetical protein